MSHTLLDEGRRRMRDYLDTLTVEELLETRARLSEHPGKAFIDTVIQERHRCQFCRQPIDPNHTQAANQGLSTCSTCWRTF